MKLEMNTFYKVGFVLFLIIGTCQALWFASTAQFLHPLQAILQGGQTIFSFLLAWLFASQIQPKSKQKPLTEDEIKKMFKNG